MQSDNELITRERLDHALSSCSIKEGQSSDEVVLARYRDAVRNDKLTPEALIYYANLLERRDVFVIGDATDALLRMVKRQPELMERIKLRSGMTLHDLVHHKASVDKSLAALRKGVSDTFKKEEDQLIKELVDSNHHFFELLNRLDEAYS